MGVTSCGKTSVGEALAARLGVSFVEGDRLHPDGNVAKMSAGIPLTDEDRWPWLTLVGDSLRGNEGRVASCSALKRVYREHIRQAARRPVAFVFLDGSAELFAARIAARKGHFMPPSLLASQLATLERPSPDEFAKAFDVAQPVDEIADEAAQWLEGCEGSWRNA